VTDNFDTAPDSGQEMNALIGGENWTLEQFRAVDLTFDLPAACQRQLKTDPPLA
jgi:hypothetical protein